jgi:hypothetical protein
VSGCAKLTPPTHADARRRTPTPKHADAANRVDIRSATPLTLVIPPNGGTQRLAGHDKAPKATTRWMTGYAVVRRLPLDPLRC